jgi:hypothetical protein
MTRLRRVAADPAARAIDLQESRYGLAVVVRA